MTPGIVSYETPDAAVIDTDASATVLEITRSVSEQPFDIDGGITANAQTINREIPGPILRLDTGDTAIVRLIKDVPHRAAGTASSCGVRPTDRPVEWEG